MMWGSLLSWGMEHREVSAALETGGLPSAVVKVRVFSVQVDEGRVSRA